MAFSGFRFFQIYWLWRGMRHRLVFAFGDSRLRRAFQHLPAECPGFQHLPAECPGRYSAYRLFCLLPALICTILLH